MDPDAGAIVHVSEADGQACNPAVVLDGDGRGRLKLRVLRPSPAFGLAGSEDSEAWYPHRSAAGTFHTPNPADPDHPTERPADSWHHRHGTAGSVG